MVDQPRVLNLDELFGVSRPTFVILEGERYELSRPEAFGPKEIQRLGALQRRLTELHDLRDDRELTERQDRELRETAAEELRLLCPALAAKRPTFLQTLAVIQFYNQEIAGAEEGDDPKKAESLPTGEKSTPD